MIDWEIHSDWAHPYPFRALRLESEHDAELGQWCVQFALLGSAVELTWVYDADTPLRAELEAKFADGSWLDKATVTMSHADYRELTEKAEKWEASQK